jgi:hypothetical protein
MHKIKPIKEVSVLFIDRSVIDYQYFLHGLGSDIQVYLLPNGGNGITEITKTLAAFSEENHIREIHIISHGSPGCLQLGNAQLSLDTIAEYAVDVQTWFASAGSAVSAHSSSLLLYGCNVAVGDAGAEFVGQLHQLTGANVAASSTPVGHTTLQGNWQLDYVLGEEPRAIAISPEVQRTYPHILTSEVGTLDTRHFIPPFFTRNDLQDNQALKTHYLLLSNPDNADINVTIRNANGFNEVVRVPANGSITLNLGGANAGVGPSGETVTFSGFPAPNGETLQAPMGLLGDSELNTVNTTDGMILEGTGRFYANVRHASDAQGMSLTSKGQTALGKRFRTGHLLSNGQTADQKSNFFSVMAFEDGTTVDFSDLPAGLTYVNGTPPSSIVLNAGESLTIGVTTTDNLTSNTATFASANDGINILNGTLITSDKPIVVNSGSWLGGANGGSRDIGVDQIMPTSFLGNEYIVAAGAGGNNETPLIVADTDNTEIYVNGGTTAIATIDAGDYYFIDPTLYSANGTMYIQTSEPVYLYQNTDANANAAQGLNFVPPLSDTLDLQDIVIPNISLLGTSSVNVVARVGSTVTVTENGNPVTLPAAESIVGAPDWEIYFLTGLSGDIKLVSDQPIYTSLTTVQGVRGAAGFFSGFPNSYAVNDNVATPVDTPFNIFFRTNDVNGIFDFEIFSNTDPANGSIILNDAGTPGDSTDDYFEYTPNPGFKGVDTFSYVIRDLITATVTDSAVITVTVDEDDDGDGVPNIADLDDDDDGILDRTENDGIDPSTDTDGDDIPDWNDPDTAGFVDSNGDNVDDRRDTDLDGTPDYRDLDADGDGLTDLEESGIPAGTIAALDTNGDGKIDAGNNFGTNGFADALETIIDEGSINYTLRDTDGDGLPNFQDTNEAPVITSDGGNSTATINIDEGDTAITTVTSTDADVGDTPTYSITGGADSTAFEINSTTGELTLKSAPDFESPADVDNNNSYIVEVTVTDSGGETDVQTLTVNVSDRDDSAPIITSSGSASEVSFDIDEGTTDVTDVESSDNTDSEGSGLTYSISGTDASEFNIDPNTGVLTFTNPPSFASPTDNGGDNTYELTVTVKDQANLTDSQDIIVNVLPVDNVPPTVDIQGEPSQVNTTAPFTVIFEFSEDVTGFEITDVTVGNGSASNFTQVDGNTYTADITPNGNGNITIDVPADIAQDLAGNNNTAAPQATVTFDNTPPTVDIQNEPTNINTTNPFTVTFEFSEDVTGFEITDITVDNGSASNFTQVDGNTYTADITPNGNGNITIDVPADIAQDLAGNNNTAAPQATVTFDNTPPTVDIQNEPTNINTTNPFTVTFEFSEDVTGFEITDITVDNGSASNFTQVDGNTYTADITPDGNGDITIDVPADTAQDLAGNNNTAAPQATVTFDADVPTVDIQGEPGIVSSTAPFTVTFEFSEDVTGFEINDVTVGNGSASNFTQVDGNTYTADITPDGNGDITIDVPADTAQDLAGNNNTATPQATVTFDNTPPTVDIQNEPTNINTTNPFTVTFEFSEDVTGFEVNDIAVGNGSASNFTQVDGNTYTADITPNGNGNITIDVPADIAQDLAGNNNTAAPQATVTFDNTPPTVDIQNEPTNINTTNPFTVTFEFSEDVTGFEVNDIAVGNGSANNFTQVDGNTYTADITPNGNGNITIDVPADIAQDLAGNNNTAAPQATVTFDNTPPTVDIQNEPTNINTTNPFTVTFEFSEDVTGFEITDVTVGNGSASNFTQVDGNTYTADITPNGNGNITIDVPADIAQDLAGNNNTAAPQATVTFDADVPTVDIQNEPSIVSSTAPFTVTFEFSEDVTGFEINDVTVGNGSASNFTQVDGNTYTADITPDGNGNITIDVPANTAQDLAGNNNTAAPQATVTFDADVPAVDIQNEPSIVSSTAPFTVTFEFSEDVTGFEINDVTVGNGSASNFTQVDGNTYTADITPDGNGNITINVPADTAQDLVGNNNAAAPQATVLFDDSDTDSDGIADVEDIDDDNDGILDNVEGLSDRDNDGKADSLDPDSDGDGIPDNVEAQTTAGFMAPSSPFVDNNNNGLDDKYEGNGLTPIDTDNDGTPDYLDTDSDDDGINDAVEGTADVDADGQPNYRDLDSDDDGIDDAIEAGPNPNSPVDTDNDGTPDFQETDSDNDGIDDAIEAGPNPNSPVDTDNDGTPDFQETDSDNDGIDDAIEAGPNPNSPVDTDNDGTPDFQETDSDNDGIDDAIEAGPNPNSPVDTDNDGTPDFQETDSDNDGIDDAIEAGPNPNSPIDTDNDGIPDFQETDSDNDGIDDAIEAGPNPNSPVDTDNDGTPDFQETDSDNDGIDDAIEAGPNPDNPLDTDNDGIPDFQELDSDDDGILDTIEAGQNPANPIDTDEDGTPDFQDLDSDNDGISDAEEGDGDVDGDGVIDYLDIDNDNDGILDVEEGNGDTDNDGTPDYLDLDSDGDGISDLTESGLALSTLVSLDSDRDGVIDPSNSFGANGLADGVETSDTATAKPDYDRDGNADLPADTDNDGRPDFQDLDTDNDGLPDASEASDSSTTDSNGDGIIDSDRAADTDNNGVPDYRQVSNVSGTAGADSITGSDGDDIINGLSDNDILDGGAGNDVINGGSEEDIVIGGLGDDVLNGGSGSDQITSGEGDDIADGGSGNDQITGDAGNDLLNGGSGDDSLDGGSGEDLLQGSDGQDWLNGGADNDLLDGGQDNDILIGGEGADVLTGGQGEDTFKYTAVNEFGDTITDFEIVSDRIDLSGIAGISFDSLQFQQVGEDTVINVLIGGHAANDRCDARRQCQYAGPQSFCV